MSFEDRIKHFKLTIDRLDRAKAALMRKDSNMFDEIAESLAKDQLYIRESYDNNQSPLENLDKIFKDIDALHKDSRYYLYHLELGNDNPPNFESVKDIICMKCFSLLENYRISLESYNDSQYVMKCSKCEYWQTRDMQSDKITGECF